MGLGNFEMNGLLLVGKLRTAIECQMTIRKESFGVLLFKGTCLQDFVVNL